MSAGTGSTGGADTCELWGAVCWHWLWGSRVPRVGKALCYSGMGAQGNCALHGAAGREHSGMLLCVEKLWGKHSEEPQIGVCKVLINVTPKHHPKPRRNVPYP